MFRTMDISDPVPGGPGVRHVTVKSPALGRRVDVSVCIPPGQDPLPLAILLHGVYGSHWNWTVNGGAATTLAALVAAGEVRPMALAMPSDGLWGDGSAYLRHGREDVETFIVEEVPAIAQAVDGRAGADGRPFIAGLSMGGFGAVRLAHLHPGRFTAVAAMSSVTRLDELLQLVEEAPSLYPTDPGTDALLEVVSRSDPASRPRLRIDCGVDDPFLEANRLLHAGLVAADVAHEYTEQPGGHDWPYWRARLPDVLRFFDANA
ncbi:MAG: alpha/beta hydrolase-fold protein [Candidatus Dormibacteria bacterium]